MKRIFSIVLAVLMVLSLAACGGKKEAAAADGKLKVALVVNQRFGDGGVVDDMGKGAEKAAADFGVELKTLESESEADHEENLRAMAQAGYGLIITTFTGMSEATKTIAKEFPDTKFVAIYQFINDTDEKLANVRSLEFRGNEGMFVEGYIAGLVSPAHHCGFLCAGEESGTSAEANGWLLGAASARADMQLEYACINNFEDPVKAKEMALAMIGNGTDVLHVASCKSGNGVIEASADSGTFADSDVKDYYEDYNGMIGYCGMGFDTAVYDSVKAYKEGNLETGVHGILDLTNGGYYIDYASYERFAEDHPEMKDQVLAAIEEGKKVEEKIKAGELKIEYDPDPSDVSRSAANAFAELNK